MNLYVVGDSISIHYGPDLKRYLAGVMGYARKEGEEEALLNLDKPSGANGGDSSMVLSFLKGKAAAGGVDADLVLVNCGLHDIKTDPQTRRQQIPIEDYATNLRAIIEVVAKMDSQLIWIRTTPLDEAVHNKSAVGFHRFSTDHEAYLRVADEIMAAAHVPVIDLHTFTAKLGPDLFCDHVHFHESIREKQAAYIAGWLDAYRGNLAIK